MGAAIASTVSKSLLEGPHVHRNLSTPQLVEAAIARGEARLASNGAVVALTGARTGRSPRDKFMVKDALTEGRVDWGKVNQPFPPDRFAALLERVERAHAGAGPVRARPVRRAPIRTTGCRSRSSRSMRGTRCS